MTLEIQFPGKQKKGKTPRETIKKLKKYNFSIEIQNGGKKHKMKILIGPQKVLKFVQKPNFH